MSEIVRATCSSCNWRYTHSFPEGQWYALEGEAAKKTKNQAVQHVKETGHSVTISKTTTSKTTVITPPA